MEYVYRQQKKKLIEEKDFERNEKFSKIVKVGSEQNLSEVLREPQKFGINNDSIDQFMRLQTKEIRENIMNNFLCSENLHILMGNGCSVYAGSKKININNKDELGDVLKNINLSGYSDFEVVDIPF